METGIDVSAMFDRVTRFDVTDEQGVAYMRYGVEVQVQVQDDGRTLKVFVQEREAGE